MDKIVKMNGMVYLVSNWDRKGFETYYPLGKDPSLLEKEDEDKPKKNHKKKDEV